MIKRIRLQNPIRLTSEKSEANPKTLPVANSSWLAQLALQDLDNLKQRVRVEVRRVHFSGLNDKVPYFQLVVKLFNSSVFKVKLLRCDGFIQLNGSHCAPPQLDKLPELEHGTSGEVTLHQSLNDATAQWLMKVTKTDNKVNIVCIMCQFVFQVTSGGYNKQVEIILNDGGLNCTPKGIAVISNGQIGTVMS